MIAVAPMEDSLRVARGGRRQRIKLEATAAIQERDKGELAQQGSIGGTENW